MQVLVVSYAFPPVGGAGVQRVLKLVKYLPEHGIMPSVLTVRNQSVPLRDCSLLREVPETLEVVRAPTLEPAYRVKELGWRAAGGPHPRSSVPAGRGWVRARAVSLAKSLLIPDPQLLWIPGATAALCQKLRHAGAEQAVLISGPPFSQLILGALARIFPGTAVVFDYRDEWTTTSSYEMSSPSAARVSALLERSLLASAHVVTTATEAFRERLLSRFAFLHPERVVVIENGYDPADLPASLPAPPPDRFVAVHVGTIFRLTSAAGLLEAVRLLEEREPVLSALLTLRFVGRIVETEARHFLGSEALGVERVGYVDHARALEELGSSHLALCLLDDVEGAERIHPAKIFEIMLLRRPCLTLCPEGALADLVRRHGVGQWAPPRDAPRIAEILAGMLREHRAGKFPRFSMPRDTERFDRRQQAGRFADAIRQASSIVRSGTATVASPPPGCAGDARLSSAW